MDFGLGPAIPTEEVGYARVSDQHDQDPDFQIALLKKRGIPDANIFVDMASGRSMDRPALRKALMLMEGRPGWTLVIYKLDRLGRNALGLMEMAREFEAKGWNLVSLTDQIDTRTPMGRAFFGMMAIMAQLESDLISERTRAGVARRAEKGLPIGRKSKLTPAKWAKLQADIENGVETYSQLAKRYSIHVNTVTKYFPDWRVLNDEEKAEVRAKRPLPRY